MDENDDNVIYCSITEAQWEREWSRFVLSLNSQILAPLLSTHTSDHEHLPKSIPSETLPRATDNNIAPLPFSQAWKVKQRLSLRH